MLYNLKLMLNMYNLYAPKFKVVKDTVLVELHVLK